MLRRHLLNWIKRIVLVNPNNFDIQDLVLIHMLHITLSLIIVSAIFNPFLEVPDSVIIINLLSSIIIMFFYWLTRFKKRFALGKLLYLSYVFVMINFLWIETAGSSGPTLIYIVAFIPMLTFMLNNKALTYSYIVIGINIPALILLEAYWPDLIKYYPSELYRVLDILMVSLVFILFEIPLIIYIKKLVITQRNNAREVAIQKTSYITNLSHEIRTPMNAILGFSELLNQDDLEIVEQKSYIQQINENGNTLLLLLNNIINISKIEHGQTEVSLSQFNALQIITRVHSSLSYKQSQLVDFKVIASEKNDEIIYSDAMFLYQILSNLTYNALKFTKKGFVHMDIQSNNDSVTFIVKDSGIGICESKQAYIFKQFEQAKSDYHMINLNGSGLGLAISSNLTEKLNGHICFESEKNVGTTFYLTLPFLYS